MANENGSPTYGFPNKKIQVPVAGISSNQKLNQPYLVDLVTLERLVFQSIPTSIKYNPESNFQAVASAGRNNPKYQYIGSEDILSFNLSWYAEVDAKTDVIQKLKWLESLTKNNGYDEKPHLVQFSFGDMYRDSKWLVTAAPYEISLFDRVDGMFPKLATSELTLKRVTIINRTRTDILSIYS